MKGKLENDIIRTKVCTPLDLGVYNTRLS